jgi:hypothetical protein
MCLMNLLANILVGISLSNFKLVMENNGVSGAVAMLEIQIQQKLEGGVSFA